MTENIKTKDSEKEELQKIEDEIKNHKDKISPVCDEILRRLLCIAKGESADIMVDELVKERQNAIQEYHRISESSKKGDDGESVSESSKKGDDEENVSVSKRVQAFLLIKRYINIIKFFLEKYEKKIPKELLDYYLFDNRLKEINNIGLAFYMDVHFEYKREEERTYIYRCDGSTTKGIEKQEKELFKKVLTKEELLKKIVELSQVHISKRISYDNSQKDWFQSYSACMGRNLHRYFDAPGFDSEARYEIANGSFVNTIKYTDNRDKKNTENVDKEDKVEYIQEVLWNGGIEEQIEEQEGTARFKNIGFCLAMYNVRDNANKNFSEWSKAYLKGSIDWNALSSDRESNDENLSVESRNKRLLGAIPDYEIVTTMDYYKQKEELDSRKRHKIVFELDAAERIGLLFHYYKEYLSRAKKTSERHENIEEKMRNKVNGILDCFFNNKQNCEKELSIIWDQFESFREKTKYLINDGTNSESIEKIRNILTYVNWEKEIKYMENIYVTMLNEDKKNPHVNPNTMYGLDSKETKGEYIVNNIYRLIVSRIKLELLNIAVFDGKKTIAICETQTKPSNGRYIFTDFN